MTFSDLVQKYTWLDIEPVFLQLHPNQSHGLKTYGRAHDELRHLEPVAADESIAIEEIWDEKDQRHIVDVYCTNAGERFGLDLVLWPEWLNMQIDKNTLARYSEEEIISHCLYEMTFWGHTLGEVTAHRDEVMQRSDRPS